MFDNLWQLKLFSEKKNMWEKKILIILDENKCWMMNVSKFQKIRIPSWAFPRVSFGVGQLAWYLGNRVTIARLKDKIKKIKNSEWQPYNLIKLK